MSSRALKTLVVRVRNLFSKKDLDPKEPRKKIQLQLAQLSQKFQEQKKLLEDFLESSDTSESVRDTGRSLLQEANRIDELQLIRINEVRLASLYSSLIDVNDFSIWLRHELSVITEEIFHFLAGVEDR